MVKKTIEVTVSPDGEVIIEPKGYSGAECERATAEIEKALGKVAGNREFKPERFERKQDQKQEATSW